MKDALSVRMKESYEGRYKYKLPRRTYSIVRVDGKAFSKLTRRNYPVRPFDLAFVADMDAVAMALCKEMAGSVLAYAQSDEISILLTDFNSIHTEAWFDGNIQKITSITASTATAAFNRSRLINWLRANGTLTLLEGEDLDEVTGGLEPGCFDARIFQIPDPAEVANYFVWRQQDAIRNSIQMAANALFSQKEMHKKNTSELKDMMATRGVDWETYDAGLKYGRVFTRRLMQEEISFKRKDLTVREQVTRRVWTKEAPPVFGKHRDYLLEIIPQYPLLAERGDNMDS